MLPVAAHMKLLLDAPEALYGFMGNGEYLKAGYLWLVARVTKEGLSGMGDASEVSDECWRKRWSKAADGFPDVSIAVAEAVGDFTTFPTPDSSTSDREIEI